MGLSVVSSSVVAELVSVVDEVVDDVALVEGPVVEGPIVEVEVVDVSVSPSVSVPVDAFSPVKQPGDAAKDKPKNQA